MSSFKKIVRKAKKVLRKKSYKPKKISFAKKVLSVMKKTAEKKHISYSNAASPLSVGQVDGLNSAGYFFLDMTPSVSQNAGYNGRIGSDIDVVSANLRFQFYQQASTFCNIKIKYQLIYVPNNNENSLSLMMSQMYQNNPFNGIIDFNSARNPDYMKSYRILRTGYCTLPNDPASVTTQNMIKETRLGFKFKKPVTVRFSGNSNSIAQGRIMLLIMADNGNKNGTTACTLNVPTGAINTGALFNYVIDYYYTDI